MEPQKLLKANPFADDDGSSDFEVAQALAISDDALRIEALVEALKGARVFVPVVAVDEKTQEDLRDGDDALQQVFIEVAKDRKAISIFTSVEHLLKYDSNARPVPVYGRNIAAQALMHSGLLIINPVIGVKGADILGRSASAAIASNDSWLAPWYDAKLHSILKDSLAVIPRLIVVWIKAAKSGGVIVAIELGEDATKNDAQRAVAIVSHVIKHDDYVHSHLDLVHIIPMKSSGGI